MKAYERMKKSSFVMTRRSKGPSSLSNHAKKLLVVPGVLLAPYVGAGDVDSGVEALSTSVAWERMLISLVAMLKYVSREYCWNLDVSTPADVPKLRRVSKEQVPGPDTLIISYQSCMFKYDVNFPMSMCH